VALERLHVTLVFWDLPRSGIADFQGTPHYFECDFDATADEYAETHVLTRAVDELVVLAREHEAIRKDWWRAYQCGNAPAEANPQIPGQNPRLAELEKLIEAHIAAAPAPRIRAHGTFHAFPNAPAGEVYKVEWRPLV
jgi:hypothetical protein